MTAMRDPLLCLTHCSFIGLVFCHTWYKKLSYRRRCYYAMWPSLTNIFSIAPSVRTRCLQPHSQITFLLYQGTELYVDNNDSWPPSLTTNTQTNKHNIARHLKRQKGICYLDGKGLVWFTKDIRINIQYPY